MSNQVLVNKVSVYDVSIIEESLTDSLFECINPGNTVVLKPNWVKESHLRKPNEWEHVITHPAVITAVLKKVISRLGKGGKIIITDGPQTDSSFKAILARNPVDLWEQLCAEAEIALEIIDLRDDEWIQKDDVTIKRTRLEGDPKGKTEVNLTGELSEFYGHKKSARGYYGADYNMEETNKAHNGFDNLYKVSRSVMEADVFINLPKLKTHKKAGITCCLKNLVGINTYKNYLPHHSEGSSAEGGDQFRGTSVNSRIEGPVLAFIKQHFLKNVFFASIFRPVKKIGKKIFGDTNTTIRSGNWHGNDTVWRMILDLNKVLFYACADGTLHQPGTAKMKKYIGIVDAISAGQGNGPLEPDPIKMGYIICGTNPVAIDSVCAKLMGFDPLKIPVIRNSFLIKHYPLFNFKFTDIVLNITNKSYSIGNISSDFIVPFAPHFGWKNLTSNQ